MKQQIEQLLKTVKNRQAKISEEQSAVDEEIKQIEKMVEQENKSWKDFWEVPEKTFENYCYEYGAVPGVGLDTPPEELTMESKFGLLWYMIKDKKGGLVDFLDIISMIARMHPNYRDAGTDVSEKVFKLLPQKFIHSFKDKK